EEHAPVHEAVGDRALAHPEALILDRMRHRASHAAVEKRGDIGLLELFRIEPDELQPPQILAIDGGEEGPGPLGSDEDVAKCLELVVILREVADAQINRHRPIDVPLAADLDAQQVAHRAGEAVAADEIGAAQRLALIGAHVAQDRGDALAILNEAFELRAMAKYDLREAPRVILENRVEPSLGTGHRPLGAESRGNLFRKRGRLHPPELIALHIGDEGAVEAMLERKAPIAHRVGDAELAAKLHGSDAHLEHLRRADLVFVLLDEQRAHAASAQIAREREPNRAASGDQYRHIDAHSPPPPPDKNEARQRLY